VAVAFRFLLDADYGIVIIVSDKALLLNQFLAKLADVQIRTVKVCLQRVVKITAINKNHDPVISVH
jgi:hypothetical protein